MGPEFAEGVRRCLGGAQKVMLRMHGAAMTLTHLRLPACGQNQRGQGSLIKVGLRKVGVIRIPIN